jgi:hypothetical protein
MAGWFDPPAPSLLSSLVSYSEHAHLTLRFQSRTWASILLLKIPTFPPLQDEDFANQVSDVFTITYDSKPVLVSLPKSGKNVWTSEDGSLTVVRGTETSQVELTLEGHFRTTLTASAHEFPDGHHIDFDVDELNITSECTCFQFQKTFLESLSWAAADA